jgi:hypothetical protein
VSLPDRLYEALSPLERLRAAISAKARGDVYEREKLLDTCEEKLYKATDWQFTGRGELLHLIALAHTADVLKLAYRTSIMTSAMLLMEQDGTELDRFIDAQQTLCAQVEGMERGFERFLDALGFNVHEVRASFGITRVHVSGCGEAPRDDVSLVTIDDLDPAVIGAKAQERYEYYGRLWVEDFRDLADIAAPKRAQSNGFLIR